MAPQQLVSMSQAMQQLELAIKSFTYAHVAMAHSVHHLTVLKGHHAGAIIVGGDGEVAVQRLLDSGQRKRVCTMKVVGKYTPLVHCVVLTVSTPLLAVTPCALAPKCPVCTSRRL